MLVPEKFGDQTWFLIFWAHVLLKENDKMYLI